VAQLVKCLNQKIEVLISNPVLPKKKKKKKNQKQQQKREFIFCGDKILLLIDTIVLSNSFSKRARHYPLWRSAKYRSTFFSFFFFLVAGRK
jgi:hypothetical protein